MKRALLLMFAVLFAFSIVNAPPVLACSGPSVSVDDYFKIYPDLIVVQAAPIEPDSGSGAIYQVSSYLYGQPAGEFLRVGGDLIFAPTVEREGLVNFCSGGGLLSTDPGQSDLLFLRRTETGVYQQLQVIRFRGEPRTASVNFEDPENGDSVIWREITEAEFIAWIDATLHLPLPDQPYPLKRILEFTTSDGESYWLPVDGADPIPIDPAAEWSGVYWLYGQPNCLPETCRSERSANGVFFATQVDSQTIALNDRTLIGTAFRFAPTSDQIAIWNGAELQFHRMPFARFATTYDWRSDPPEPERISLAMNSTMDLDSLSGRGMWSPEGRFFAYSDADGLWLYDTYGADERLLVDAADGVTFARHFSPLGQLLAVEQNGTRFNLDVFSGVHYADGLVSPDDRTLLAFDSSASVIADLRVCPIPFGLGACAPLYDSLMFGGGAGGFVYRMWDEREGYLIPLTELHSVEWIDRYTFITFACGSDTHPDREGERLCGLTRYEFDHTSFHWSAGHEAWAYSFDPINDVTALLTTPTAISVYGTVTQTYDLTAILNGETIVSLQWGT